MFSLRERDAVLASTQVAGLARQVPVLLATLALSSVGVAYTHYGIAPDGLTIWPLCCLLTICFVRFVSWVRMQHRPIEGPAALRRVRGTNVATAVLAGGFSAWAMALTAYGDSGAQIHVIFFLAITMIVCLQCLMHLRSAAVIVATCAIPAVAYFALQGNVLLAVAAHTFSVGVGAMIILHRAGFRDFCRLAALIEENRRLAHTDALTGLPNRRSFFGQLEETIARAGAENRRFTVGLIDLDGFKPVNDSFGHHAGDEVLLEVAGRLENVMAGIGWAARLGGDEFGLIIEGERDLEAIGRQLCACLQMPYVLRDTTAQIGASVGFAAFPDAADSAELLLERADYALYFAKAFHRGTAISFAPEHEARLRSHAIIEQALRSADLESELTLAFQPIVDVVEQRIDAYEALARWTSPSLGIVSPADFILVAERSGLILEISRTLLQKALAAMAEWPDEIRLSFNLSAHDIASSESLARITELVVESGIAPARIIFELTETGLMRDLVDAREALLALKALGVRIALDDFGTGYSSLSYVHRLPIDKLKIDRSFVTHLCEDKASLNVIRAILDLSRNLGYACVVEGVETADQMLLLRSAGCRFMQGYLFLRPLPQAQIEARGHVLAPISVRSDAAPLSSAA